MKRPAGVTIIAILGFILAGLLVAAGLAICLWSALVSKNVESPAGLIEGVSGTLIGVALLVVAAVGIATGIGLLKVRSWARIVTIVAAGLTLLVAALGLLEALERVHMPFLFGALVRRAIVAGVDVWILAYLFHPSVKQAFAAKA